MVSRSEVTSSALTVETAAEDDDDDGVEDELLAAVDGAATGDSAGEWDECDGLAAVDDGGGGEGKDANSDSLVLRWAMYDCKEATYQHSTTINNQRQNNNSKIEMLC